MEKFNGSILITLCHSGLLFGSVLLPVSMVDILDDVRFGQKPKSWCSKEEEYNLVGFSNLTVQCQSLTLSILIGLAKGTIGERNRTLIRSPNATL